MRFRHLAVAAALLLTTPAAFAADAFLGIGGSVGVFRTDARVFNPGSSDITIEAYFLPVGNGNNSSVQPINVTIGPRQMRVFDDVVTTLFQASGLGAIRLTSGSPFIATSRIYATAANGTLGQFVPGLPVSEAKTKGVLIQLKSTSAFRTNVGVVNAHNVPATVTWRLYDKNNALVATGTPIVMPPYAVIGPTNIASGFFFNAGTSDLTDAWVSYTSDSPIFAYASVIDNGTTDPTFIPMSEDTGTTPTNPQPNNKTINVTLRSFAIDFPATAIGVGDKITLNITAQNTIHGFQLVDPSGATLVQSILVNPGETLQREFTATRTGTYTYFCTRPTCGTGHDEMVGSFNVVTEGGNERPGY